MPTARRLGVWALTALLLSWSAAASRGDVIFSSLPATGNSGGTATASDSLASGGVDFDLAQRFSVTADWRFTDAQLPLFNGRGPAVATVWLMGSNGALPGAVIEEMSVTDIAAMGWPLRTATSALRPVLSAGQTYWIGLSTNRGTDVAWGHVASSANGNWYRRNQGSWEHDALNDAWAFQVNGTPVPEPSCLMALLLPAVALRRTRQLG